MYIKLFICSLEIMSNLIDAGTLKPDFPDMSTSLSLIGNTRAFPADLGSIQCRGANILTFSFTDGNTRAIGFCPIHIYKFIQ